MKWVYGWKFLSGAGCTEYNGISFEYSLPARGQKWSGWTEHPDPAEPDGKDCGPGRLHVMNSPDAMYAPPGWWIWLARYHAEDVLGVSKQKTGVARIQLRRVTPKQFAGLIRRGWCEGANLHGANLHGANLHGANLQRADLYGADLHGANLQRADLQGADLHGAKLHGADLQGADLQRAKLPKEAT